MKKGFRSLWLFGMRLEGEALRKIFLLSILASLFQLALPLGIQALMGFISGGEFRLGTLSVVFLVLLATWMANRWQIEMVKTGEQIEERLFVLMAYEYAQRLFIQPAEGSFQKFASKAKYFIEISGIQKGYSKSMIEIIGACLQLILGVMLISFYHPFFMIFGLSLLIGLFVIIRTKGRQAVRTKVDVSNEKYGMYDWLQKQSKEMGDLNQTKEELHGRSLNYVQAKRDHFSVVLFQMRSFLFFKMCIITGMLLLGVWLAIEQKISLGQFLAAELVIVLVVNSIEKLLFGLSSIYETMVSFEKGFTLIADTNSVDADEFFQLPTTDQYPLWHKVQFGKLAKRYKYRLMAIIIAVLALLLLPWTQNIEADGKVISLEPNQRPQSVETIIAGRIEKWYVQEGDSVAAGDTLLFLSEIKDDYFDPELLNNTDRQIKSKESAVDNYMEKVKALDTQIDALLNAKDIKREQILTKLQQAHLKIKTDSTDLIAVENNYKVAQEQMKRYDQLYKQELISRTEWEGRQVSLQNAQAKINDQRNKLAIAKAELLNTQRDYRGVEAEYRDKISKAESDKFSTFSAMYDAEAQVTKLQNQFNNYDKRTGYYYIIAPQNGFVSKVTKSGIGETVKEGEEVVRITPHRFDKAVELWIDPVNNPLIHNGEHVRIIFDGWPAFVISGWNQMSTGLFDGTIVSVDPAIQENGKFRVWVKPINDKPWPENLRLGGGVKGIMLLNDVPLGYEMWRVLNGFPPDFYQPQGKETKSQVKEEKK
jgi:multidrug efflux pump subunit AcrA (membrane-fusion protein)